jgi:hypothetical protein
MDVLLPRPRRYRVLISKACLELKREALHEEARRAVAAGSRAGRDLVEAYSRLAGREGRTG